MLPRPAWVATKHNMLLVPRSHKEIEIKFMASGLPLENLRPIRVVLVVLDPKKDDSYPQLNYG